ncbi:MAG TPA: hypothetical protein VKY92_15955 [Verrucomicrobiae bacterium]|nr:hypothetical protein [Verrucomicrobiae bacterium]
MKSVKPRRWFFVLLLLALAVVSAALLMPPKVRLPAVMILSRPFEAPSSPREALLRWMPTGPGWQWARSIVFGHRKPVLFQTGVFVSPSAVTRTTDLGAPVFTNDSGIEVWFLNAAQSHAFTADLPRIVADGNLVRSRVSTCDGVTASLSTGQTVILNGSTNQVGVTTSFSTRTYGDHTDLWLSAFFSEIRTNNTVQVETSSVSIVTNLDVAARLQVPRGTGLLLLKPHQDGDSRLRAGIVLNPF